MYYVIIRGPLGSGKSTISERLSKIIGAKYFAMDRILDENNLEEKEDGYISQNSFKMANEIAYKEALKILNNKQPIVFDGNFYWKSQIDDLIGKLDFPHYVFTLKAPLETCIQRDAKRDKTYGQDAATAVYKKSTEFSYGIEIDATKDVEECINEIISYLSKNYKK